MTLLARNQVDIVFTLKEKLFECPISGSQQHYIIDYENCVHYGDRLSRFQATYRQIRYVSFKFLLRGEL